MHARATIDELEKLGAISHDQAQRSLDRLESLEQQKPTAGQVARYGALGAAAGAGVGALRGVISKVPTGGVRGAVGNAIGGAITGGGIPLLQKSLDRRAEMGTVKKYVKEHEGV